MIGSPSAIIAFEAAGRHLSFTRAAAELNVSQPAISRQIRNLELHIGQPLFVRRGNLIELTQQGRFLLQETTSSFERIVAAINDMKRQVSTQTVVLRSQPIGVSAFILPLFIDMQRAFPGLRFDIEAIDNWEPFDREGPAISILYGNGHWPGQRSEMIFDEIVFPVCNPLVLREHGDADAHDIFNSVPLLQVSSFIDPWMEWRTWAAHFQIKDLSLQQPQMINDYELLLQACRSGYGIALGSLYLVADSILDGSLARITDLCIRSSFGFYLVYDAELEADGTYASLLSWLRQGAADLRQSRLPLLPEFDTDELGHSARVLLSPAAVVGAASEMNDSSGS